MTHSDVIGDDDTDFCESCKLITNTLQDMVADLREYSLRVIDTARSEDLPSIERKLRDLSVQTDLLLDRVEANYARHKSRIGQLKSTRNQAAHQLLVASNHLLCQRKAEQKRDLGIVNPDASDQELEEMIQSDRVPTDVYKSALLSSRSGKASNVLAAVESRHHEIKSIETGVLQVAKLSEDLMVAVQGQESEIVRVDEKAEESNIHTHGAAEELSGAVTKAQSALHKKMWCLSLVVLITIVIAVVITVPVVVLRTASQSQ